MYTTGLCAYKYKQYLYVVLVHVCACACAHVCMDERMHTLSLCRQAGKQAGRVRALERGSLSRIRAESYVS